MNVLQSCSWNQPGLNPYRGLPSVAVLNLSGIPAYTREALSADMWDLPTDRVWISRDRIWGKFEYAGLRDMHFGTSTICRWPQYSGWPKDHMEEASVWCRSGNCVIIPAVCGNVSVVTKVGIAVPPPANPTLRGMPDWVQRLFPGAPRLSRPPGETRPESSIPGPEPEEPTHTVSEPSTLALLVSACICLLVLRNRVSRPR